ncbi:T9SS type A sorting domain-containing protein [uncultured Winogradskyella sp.]|uniref:T9SS type A sorting domain-containing protein n=1 Tax=uncultured Winogradskyella sp. TaxID=395353 RepID=UPI00262CD232|nr:T9SS type A sorting domain-containing protein [uncultured Winogradskyella sp.]
MKKNTLITYLTCFFFLSVLVTYSQSIQNIDEVRLICEMPDTGTPNDTFVALREAARERLENRSTPCTNFVVNYTGFPSGIPAGPGTEQIAFQLAVDIWATLIESDQTIYIDANWVDTGNPSNLGGAAASYFAPLPGSTDNIIYPAALFEKLTNTVNTGDDIFCQFNSSRSDWFFPQDINGDAPPGFFNFTAVVLHEIGHGLGMAGFGRTRGTLFGTGGYIRRDVNGNTTPLENDPNAIWTTPWDTFIESNGTPILDETTFPDPSTTMLTAFTTNDGSLNCNSPIAVAQNGGDLAETYAPTNFVAGTSYSHWDESTFNGTETALMTPFLGAGEDVYDPGNVTLGFMEDMGWTLCQGSLSTENFALENVKISPNPFTQSITIELPPQIINQEFNVSIVDINGRIISNSEANTLNGEITISNLSNLKNALYFLTIESKTSDLRITKKIIKN